MPKQNNASQGMIPIDIGRDYTRIISDLVGELAAQLQPARILTVGELSSPLLQIFQEYASEVIKFDFNHNFFNPAISLESGTQVPKSDLSIYLHSIQGLPLDKIERLIDVLCRSSRNILVISAGEARVDGDCFTVWAKIFAQKGYLREVKFGLLRPAVTVAYWRSHNEPIEQIVATYEARLWQLVETEQIKDAENYQNLSKLTVVEKKLAALETRWAVLENSMSWKVADRLQKLRLRFAPPGSVKDQLLEDIFNALRTRRWRAFKTVFDRLRLEAMQQMRKWWWQIRLQFQPVESSRTIQIEEIKLPQPPRAHQVTVDIVICVHNALSDTKKCLEALLKHTSKPYSVILIDDGSNQETQNYLLEFAATHQVSLLRNEQAQGYTRSANKGLRQTTAEFVVLLNSDTIVTREWLDRLLDCVQSDPKIGLAGPLSNTASWQSIPEIQDENGDWAVNELPANVSIQMMGQLVAQNSARLYPNLPFLNGFCLLIRRQVINDIGYFDEENFGAGYGEENDYAFRAQVAGWRLAVADDVYVYHKQSRSYSDQRRKALSERAGIILARKYGSRSISRGVEICREDRVMQGIRARSRILLDREDWAEKGQAIFQGRRLLLILPIVEPSGGGNVVLDEALAMQKMGVDVNIFNLIAHQSSFRQGYPDITLPVIFGEKSEVAPLARQFDAVVATTNDSVAWMTAIERHKGFPILGYYVQEFEPYIFAPGSQQYQRAWESYTLIPDIICFTKTEWTRHQVKQSRGVECHQIGISLNIDQLRPRPRLVQNNPGYPIHIIAMVRPRSPHRNAKLTMEILRRASKKYGTKIKITIFGVSLNNPAFAQLPRDFSWQLAGILNRRQIANLLNQADIFVDFSSHQAMGLTALEAMACGVAVIVPEQGGATSFAHHQKNSLVVDTSSSDACWQALQQLIEDENLRGLLQKTALLDVCDYYVERPAFNILRLLFGSA